MLWPGSSASRYSQLTGFCEHCDEPPGVIKKPSEIID